jgi:hypothetical protein
MIAEICMPQSLKLEMDDTFDKILKDLANGGSEAEVIKKAVATYAWLKAQTENSDNSIAITDKTDQIKTKVALP